MTSENPTNLIKSDDPPVDSDAKAADHSQKTKRSPPPVSAKADAQPCCKHHEIPCHAKRDSVDWITLGLEAFGLLILIVYTVATIAIWCANKKAAEAATVAAKAAETANRVSSYSLVASQRAWLQILDKDPDEDVMSRSKQKAATIKSFAFPLTVKNVGKSPAKNIKIDAIEEIVKSGQEPKLPPYDQWHDIVKMAVLFPDLSHDLLVHLYNGKQVQERPEMIQVIDLDRGARYLAFYGIISYEDDFGKHWTHFCWWRTFSAALEEAYKCIAYNDVDRTEIPTIKSDH